MTREEALEIMKNPFSMEKAPQPEDIYAAHKMAIKALEQEPKTEWHPVAEGLPEDEEIKLVTCKTQRGVKNVNRAYYSGGSWHGSGSMAGVIAWADMPAPYEEDEA